MTNNPFDKYLGPEDNFHIACCNWMDMQFPKVQYTHPANEAKRTNFERYKAQKMRMKPGAPDLLIFEGRGKYLGLAIELKIKPNKPTPAQLNFLKALEDKGWKTAVIYSIDSFIDTVNDYMYLQPVYDKN